MRATVPLSFAPRRVMRPGSVVLDPGALATLKPESKLQVFVHHAAAYTGTARPRRAGSQAQVTVSDGGTLGGLTQFATQFGFVGSSTSL